MYVLLFAGEVGVRYRFYFSRCAVVIIMIFLGFFSDCEGCTARGRKGLSRHVEPRHVTQQVGGRGFRVGRKGA